jgi:hypothetical protein
MALLNFALSEVRDTFASEHLVRKRVHDLWTTDESVARVLDETLLEKDIKLNAVIVRCLPLPGCVESPIDHHLEDACCVHA